MEINPHGRNPREEGEDREESAVFKNRIPLMLPGSSSSSSSTVFRWSGAGSGSSGAPGTAPSSSDGVCVEKEHMFDKVVTPSDVGKLNRLVIPKQYAEKYFPLDPTSGEKGLLLSFEDRTGKPWRFRYSYWNSSQSYVMTKGWSRFVKEKRLDAGDTVSFGRGVGEQARDRLFIDWKRRSEATHDLSRIHQGQLPFASFPFPRSIGSWGHSGFYLPPSPPATLYEHHQNRQALGQQFMWFRSSMSRPPQIATPGLPVVLDSVPVGSGPTTAKRVRLFGVDLDSPESERNSSNDANVVSLTMPNWQSRPITSALPLFELSSNGANESSSAAAVVDSTSSSSRKEGHSSLDLDL